MGGYGSGRRWDAKSTVEETNRIDIRWLKKQGCLRPGYAGTISWSCNGSTTGTIGARMAGDNFILNYNHRGRDGEWVPAEQTIRLSRSECHFGGHRLWFECPWCHKRVAVLCGAGKYFLCRHCYGLNFASQHESEVDRMLRRARKIRKQLEADMNMMEPIVFKPKWMRWRMFERLRREAEHANSLSWAIAGQRWGQ
ncbi:hypothetical protein [Desulfofustis glycolicus]|uniref:Uncharacterized protein n=1 Tax=Desulfofustis glycolicus DSM 9705 TaxID=1121409 RepID=A0A1M5XRF7_9BACT|nr:hypothetical protein [Desulfofustis glycolicus]SHI01843.1 hypothetical protein SAMN02745124_03236 [Desulfofustis glycolicus DSM 9705]